MTTKVTIESRINIKEKEAIQLALKTSLWLFLCNATILGITLYFREKTRVFDEGLMILFTVSALCVISYVGLIKMIANLFKMMSDRDVQKTSELNPKFLLWILVKGICVVVFFFGILKFQEELNSAEKLIPLLLGASTLITVPIISGFKGGLMDTTKSL
jgi:nicotinamide riboside transporter PnuC